MNKIKTVQAAITAVSIIFIAWVLASWFDVILHNASSLPHYQSWNAFVRFFDWMGYAV